MPRPRSGSEVESLQAQLVDLERRVKDATARERAKKAADDHRRFLIAGAAALDHMAAEPQSAFAGILLGLINARARSASDRALFNLSTRASTSDKSLETSSSNGNEDDATPRQSVVA